MKKNAWTLVYWISLSVMGILGVIWVANSIASENGSAFLPDTVRVISVSYTHLTLPTKRIV